MVHGRHSVRYDTFTACRQLAAADPKLAKLIDRIGPFSLKLQQARSPFEALIEAIIYQQLHGKAAATIFCRLLDIFDGRLPSPEQLLAVPAERLRSAGVSRNKILALQDLAQKNLDGTVPSLAKIRRLSDASVIDRLTQVRGIGCWTAEMLLIFRLGRPDVLPVTDYGVRKGFLLTFAKRVPGKPITAAMLPLAEEILRRGERWKPWRSVASWYLWRACDTFRET